MLLFAHATPPRTGAQDLPQATGSGNQFRKGEISTDERFVFLPVFQLFFTLMKMNKKINLRVLSGGAACG
jgi:hypothetical protein